MSVRDCSAEESVDKTASINSSGENPSHTKLNYLNSKEIHLQSFVEISDKPKYFITFPYPYMNGKLHLGHLYSVSKSDFFSYFKELQGFNVLFPFSFHCTGMPISASAQKLNEELQGQQVDVSVISILESLGMSRGCGKCKGNGNKETDKCICSFVDPFHWCRTFPPLCKSSLLKFDANIDWRRSFITTEINPYYDSFVRFQFNRLKSLGLIAFGKRYSIFCPIDQQACLDHDRREGEGVKPVEAICYKVKYDDITYLVRVKDPSTIPSNPTIVAFKHSKWISFTVGNETYAIESEMYNSLKCQVDLVENVMELTNLERMELIDFETPAKLKYDGNTKKDKSTASELTGEFNAIKAVQNESTHLVATMNFVKLFVPESKVISRSGGICVVSLLDQWYIDYDNPEWKRSTKDCLDALYAPPDTKNKLYDALDWIHKWGVSRQFGLGTRLPWDEKYLIDSLSDSTIYMALYTFKHLLFRDLEGKNEIFPSALLCDQVWEFIFGHISSESFKKARPSAQKWDSASEGILVQCRDAFEHFYPVDLRVSGKDLIPNHLLFFIMNHVALFPKENWPRRIFTNGHLMLNSAKMSKSSGNFLTVDDALAKFGTSSTRLCLAAAGDTNEDANFVESSANSFILKLYTFTKAVEEVFEVKIAYDSKEPMSLIDLGFLHMLYRNILLSIEAHEQIVYRDVLKYAFYENLHFIELYDNLGGNNRSLIQYAYSSIIQLMYPVIPSLVRYLMEVSGTPKHLPQSFGTSNYAIPKNLSSEYADSCSKISTDIVIPTTKYIDSIEYVKSLCNKLMNKSYSRVKITVSQKYVDWKEECIREIDRIVTEEQLENHLSRMTISLPNGDLKKRVIKAVSGIMSGNKVNQKKGMIFCMDYLSFPEKYKGILFNELDVVLELKDYIQRTTGLEVEVKEKLDEDVIAEPLNPHLFFQ